MEGNRKFEFVADKGVVDAIEKFSQSNVLMERRSFTIGKIAHFDGWSTAEIVARDGAIKPDDLIWLGWFSKGIEQKLF